MCNTAAPSLRSPRFASRTAGIPGSIIDSSISLLQDQPRDVISFAMGCPAPDALPGEALAEIAREALARPEGSVLNYAATEGMPAMRKALMSLLTKHGLAPGNGEVIVTAGGMQGLDLACKLLVERGSVVLTESPTYTNATATIASYGGDVIEIPVDDDGLQISAIESAVAAKGTPPSVIHVIPNFQNPRGSTLTLERRLGLLDHDERWGASIIEDDPYGLLRFEGADVPTLLELSRGRVPIVYVGTFSKILAPGLRVGWVQASNDVVSKMIDAKQGMDTCTNTIGQHLVSEFLSRGLLQQHVEFLRSTYANKRDLVLTALDTHFGCANGVSWTRPSGGFFLWMTFPECVDTGALYAVALKLGVAVIPGSAFSPSGGFGNCVRLCFTFPNESLIDEGVRRLREAYDLGA